MTSHEKFSSVSIAARSVLTTVLRRPLVLGLLTSMKGFCPKSFETSISSSQTGTEVGNRLLLEETGQTVTYHQNFDDGQDECSSTDRP